MYVKKYSLTILHLPSITYTMLPTSPSLIITLSAAYSTGYIQSTISLICVDSKFFMKSLSKMAPLINSLDLWKKSKSNIILISTDVFGCTFKMAWRLTRVEPSRKQCNFRYSAFQKQKTKTKNTKNTFEITADKCLFKNKT